MTVLVIDVGGSHVKLAVSGVAESRRFDSGNTLTPEILVQQVKEHTSDWRYDVISLGIPGVFGRKGLIAEPGNLGPGWIGFDFQRALGREIRVVNDAVLQALGAYEEHRMLFLGLGTGLGSVLISDRVVIPLELGDLHNVGLSSQLSLGELIGKAGLERLGQEAWRLLALEAISMLQSIFMADYVVLGGGHAALVTPLPPNVRCGGNDDAFTGGFRLWEEEVHPHDGPPPAAFRVVR